METQRFGKNLTPLIQEIDRLNAVLASEEHSRRGDSSSALPFEEQEHALETVETMTNGILGLLKGFDVPESSDPVLLEKVEQLRRVCEKLKNVNALKADNLPWITRILTILTTIHYQVQGLTQKSAPVIALTEAKDPLAKKENLPEDIPEQEDIDAMFEGAYTVKSAVLSEEFYDHGFSNESAPTDDDELNSLLAEFEKNDL